MKKPETKKEKEKEKAGLKNPPGPVKPVTAGLPATFEPTQYAGLGHEESDQETYIIPRLVILQTNSPQCLEGDPAYVKGAKAGSFYNTATRTVYDGKDGIRVIMCHFQRRALKWIPRDKGGGFRGEYPIEDFDVEIKKRGVLGKLPLEDGTDAADTRYHYLFHLTKNGLEKALMGLSSTQIPVSKQWMTALRTLRIPGDKGQLVVPASFQFVCKLTTVDKSSDKGKWKLLNFEIERMLDKNDRKDVTLFYEGLAFHNQVKGGKVKPDYSEEDNPENVGDDAPF